MSNIFIIYDTCNPGTTTPITFVKDTLFPYSSKHLQSYIEDTLLSPQTQEILQSLREQHDQDVLSGCVQGAALGGKGGVVEAGEVSNLVVYAQSLITADRKVPALKRLQGLVWKQGYRSGNLNAVVYDDVPPFLNRMQTSGVSVGIYSSGSRGAQQLLFQHTNFGDLRSLLAVYFDTVVGQKKESKSYAEILLTLGYTDSTRDVLFVTDILEEAVAAREAGMRAVLSLRAGNAEITTPQRVHGFPEITSFDQLNFLA